MMAEQRHPRVNRAVHRALAGESRVQTLDILRAESAPLSVADVSERMDLHPNTVRMHLEQLVRAGLAVQEADRRPVRGRPRAMFMATAAASEERDVAAERDGFRLLADIVSSTLEDICDDPAVVATEAGRRWGRETARARERSSTDTEGGATDYLESLLGDLGFDPRTPVDATDEIELHHCPFGQVAKDHSNVACGIHLGMMQGVLAERGGPIQANTLIPFATPDYCVTRLGRDGDTANAPSFEVS